MINSFRRLSALVILASTLGTAHAATTGEEILAQVDAVENAASDSTISIRMVLIDKKGGERAREARIQQMGEKRMFKFSSPADVKGVGILVLEGDVMQLYMPAFGKTRRIASSAKNDTFMGTDFTFDDMATLSYAADYTVSNTAEDGEQTVLTLTPKESSPYDHLKMWVDGNSVFTKLEYYKAGDVLAKVLTRSDIKQVGDYWLAHTMLMEDVAKQHKTRMEITDAAFDSGLTADRFSERYLKRD